MIPRNFKTHLVGWIIILFLFLICLFFLILRVSEYRINWKTRSLEKAAIISFESNPRAATVWLNYKKQNRLTPVTLHYLLPGTYTVKIEKEGYHIYERTITVNGGQYFQIRALLFLKKPETKQVTIGEWEKVTQNPNIEYSTIQNYLPSDAADIQVFNFLRNKIAYRVGSEIWLYFPDKDPKEQHRLVARYWDEIKNLRFYPDGEHLLFIRNGFLHIIEITGTVETRIMPLEEEFWLSKNGEWVYFKKDNQLLKAKIR